MSAQKSPLKTEPTRRSGGKHFHRGSFFGKLPELPRVFPRRRLFRRESGSFKKISVSLSVCFLFLAGLFLLSGSDSSRIFSRREFVPHRYRISGVLSPSCTESGYTLFVCDGCGDTCKKQYAPPLGHCYDIRASAPVTCTTDGGVQYTCTVCGSRSLCGYEKAPGHDFGEPERREATCTWDGFVKSVCRRCGEIRTEEETPALGHDYVASEIVTPSCTRKGYTVFACSRCRKSFVGEYVRAVGHDYQKESTVSPTCTEQGYSVYACTRCQKTYKDHPVKASGHRSESGLTYLPTCTENGYDLYTCTVCGKDYRENYTPALWHDWTSSVTCSRCRQGIKYRAETGNVVYFSQWDSRWAEISIGCGSMGKNGCSPSAIAMALGYRGIKTDPLTVADWLYRNTQEFNRGFTGTSGTGIRLAAEHFGAEVEMVASYEDFLFHLSRGAAIICAQGKGNFSFTGKTHSVFMSGLDGGKVYCCDPYTQPRNGWYEASELWQERSADPVDLRSDNVVCYAIY